MSRPGGAEITVRGQLSPAEIAAVLSLAEVVAAHDGVGPLSEQSVLHLRYGGDRLPAGSLLLWRDATLAGFAHYDDGEAGRTGELAVHPAHRQRGLGGALVRAVLAGAAGQPVLLWAHGDLPAAARLAASTGFTRARALWQMRRSLLLPLAEPDPPAGIGIRSFRAGQDDQEWLELNARAFAGHPEQGKWTREDLDRREREPWFDPAGFFLAERSGRLAGYHWTKVHPGQEPTGEVYVIGVDPTEQRTGLGRALTLTGLRYLRARGIPEVMLYVEESSPGAIHLYESLGFSRATTDVVYRHDP
jgi:mycothiol synthase